MKCQSCCRENLDDALKCVGCGAYIAVDGSSRTLYTENLNAIKPLPRRIQVIIPDQGKATHGPTHRASRQIRSPRLMAVLIVIAVLLLGVVLGVRTENSELRPTPDQEVMPNITVVDSEGNASETHTVSGVDVAGSIVQVIVVDDGEVCGSGSGSVVIDSHHVLTSYHVVSSSEFCQVSEIFVETIRAIDQPPIRTHQASIVGFDDGSDLAILRISPTTESAPTPIPVKIAGGVSLGDRLTAIGFPAIGGSTVTVTTGEVSGFSKYRGVRWIKSSVSISGGNSGGGAFNSIGELVGVPSFFGSADSDEATDCRPIADTNGDGSLDENDACVPMGGFINSLSPVESVQLLIDRVTKN